MEAFKKLAYYFLTSCTFHLDYYSASLLMFGPLFVAQSIWGTLSDKILKSTPSRERTVFQILFEQIQENNKVWLYETFSKWQDLQYRMAFVPVVMGVGDMVSSSLEFVFEWSKRSKIQNWRKKKSLAK